jgi:hypothetical protein
MTMKDLIAEMFQHVLGNSVILMIICLTAIALYAMNVCKEPATMKEIVGNVVSAIAGAAGGAGLAVAALNKKNGGGPPIAPPSHLG